MHVRDIETDGQGSAGGSGASEAGSPGAAGAPGGDGGDGSAGGTAFDAVAAALRGGQPPAGADSGAAGADPAKAAATEPGKAQEVEPKPGEQASPAKDAQGRFKKADPDFAPIPGLAPEAQQRFTKLVDRVRSAEGKAVKYDEFKPQYDAMAGDVAELRQLLSDHQCEPEDLGALLEFNKLRKAGDFDGMRKAIGPILKEITLGTGQPFEAEDPLADHQDLLDEVEGGFVTRERALEVARARGEQASRAEQQRRQQQQQQSGDQAKQQSEAAIQSVSAWARELRDSDIDYVAKEPQLLARIDDVMALYGDYPDLWLPTLKREYSLLKAGGTAGAAAAGSGGGGNPRPLRPSGGGTGMRQEPKNLFEAIKLQHTGGLVG